MNKKRNGRDGENTLDEACFDLVAYIRKNYPETCQVLTTNGHFLKM